jgi:integrase
MANVHYQRSYTPLQIPYLHQHIVIGKIRMRSFHYRVMSSTSCSLNNPPMSRRAPFFIQQLCSLRDRAIALLMLCSGLRSFEVLGLSMGDIDSDDLWIGAKDRLVPIFTWTRGTIKRYIAYERPRSLATNCFLVLKEPRRGFALSKAGLRQIFRLRRFLKEQRISCKRSHMSRPSF